MKAMLDNDSLIEDYITGLALARDTFLRLRAQLGRAHPHWRDGDDARLNLVGKPSNLLLSAIINLRLTKHNLHKVEFWRSCIAAEFNTPEFIIAPLYELSTF